MALTPSKVMLEAEDEEDSNHENPPGAKPSSQEDIQLKKAIELLNSPAMRSRKRRRVPTKYSVCVEGQFWLPFFISA